MRTFNQQFLRLVPSGRKLVVGIPFLWLCLFFMLPFFLVMKISFSEAALAIPPYSEIYTYAEQKFNLLLNIGNYTLLGEDELYLSAYLGSLKVALFSTLMCLVIGFPMAYAITKASKEAQNVLMLLIMMPTWTAILIQRLFDVDRADRSPDRDPQHQHRRLHRRGVCVSAVHDPAAVRQPGQTRPEPAGSGFGPGFEHLQQLLENHRAAGQERHHRRVHAGVHSSGR